MSDLNKAVSIAIKAHKDQSDKYGMPYLGHVIRVMSMGRTDEEKICGVLHDVVEDSDITIDDLRKEGFGEDIVQAIDRLTKREPDEDYESFIDRIADNPLAVNVKLNDLADNMDIRRLNTVTEKDAQRLSKYLRAYRKLSVIAMRNNEQKL